MADELAEAIEIPELLKEALQGLYAAAADLAVETFLRAYLPFFKTL